MQSRRANGRLNGSDDSAVNQNMTDISLSSLGMMLIFFTFVAVVFQNMPGKYKSRARMRRKVERFKQKQLKKMASLAGAGKRITLNRINKLIKSSVDRVEGQRTQINKR